MKNNKCILLLFVCFAFGGKANSQAGSRLNSIDSICMRIDSLSRSFEEFDFSVNMPHVSVGARIHYIDTAYKLYKKIIFTSELDTLTKTFYFEKDQLAEVKINRTHTDQFAKYQFKENAVISQDDHYHLIKNTKLLVSEARRYFTRVRY